MTDLPDWSLLVNPLILSSSFIDQAEGTQQQLFQSLTPYRIWMAWLDLSANTVAAYSAGSQLVGIHIGDGSGKSLIKLSAYMSQANQQVNKALAIPINGYTPVLSAGFYTTNLIVDTRPANFFIRGSGGILYSQP